MSYILKVKSQLNDVFSQFGKYIAPTYYHDRCERSLQMYLYVMHKREILLSLLALISAYILLLFIGFAGPNVHKENQITAKQIFDDSSINETYRSGLMSSGPFVVTTTSLNTYSQQLCLFLTFHLKNEEASEAFHKEIGVDIQLDGIDESNRNTTIISDGRLVYQLYCGGRQCEPIQVIHLTYIAYKHYRVHITFEKLESVNNKYTIEDITFTFQSINTSFTTLSIWFRFFFLLIAFCVMFWFTHSLYRFPIADWSLEQKWTSLLLSLLLVTNNPFYPMQFLLGSSLPRVMEVLFQCSLMSAVLLFWLCFYHGIRQNNRLLSTFYAPKVGLIFVLWITMISVMAGSVTNQLENPIYDETKHFQSSTFLQFSNAIFYILLIGYFIYLSLLMMSAFTELRSMPYFDIRLKLQSFLMIFVLTVSLLTIVLSSSSSAISRIPFLQILPFSYYYGSSASFLSLFSIVNLYICICAYYYRPSHNQHNNDCRVVRDNPTLSMINDSDEDVIYGSDTEEPLQPQPKLIDTKNDDEESD
ncbi:transmembrane protein 181-like [Oppia nitens]|uniref:transmembrane protein 181-like n=1 Tax=Oppia nitens TaxID=1686743 RepID=UPI0023DBCB33|nr:transmembrane protein 181-like [Oppia nitens]